MGEGEALGLKGVWREAGFEILARISHTHSSRDAARTRTRKARPVFPAGLYENILPKEDSGRNEAGAGRSQSQQNGYEKYGLDPSSRTDRDPCPVTRDP